MATEEQDKIWFEEDDSKFVEIPQSTMDIAWKCKGIQKLKAKIFDLENEQKLAEDFYTKKIRGIEKQIDYLESQIRGYMIGKNVTSIPTHLGTPILTTRTKKVLPDEDVIKQWLRDIGQEMYIHTEEKINLAEVNKLIKTLAEEPPGTTEVSTTSLSIRTGTSHATTEQVSTTQENTNF